MDKIMDETIKFKISKEKKEKVFELSRRYFCGNVSEFMRSNISATTEKFYDEFIIEIIKEFSRDEENQIDSKARDEENQIDSKARDEKNQIDSKARDEKNQIDSKEGEYVFKIITAFLNVIKNKKKAGKNAKEITEEIPSITYDETRYILKEMGYSRKQTKPSLFIYLPKYESIVQRVCKNLNLNFFALYCNAMYLKKDTDGKNSFFEDL